MQPTVSHRHKSDATAQSIAKSVSDLIADWSPGEVFDAHQILDENPDFKNDHSVVLDLAYEEYCRRLENGEELDPSGFVARFPEVEIPLLDLIDVHQVLYDNPSVLTHAVAPQWPEVGESHLDLKLLEKIGSGSFSQVYIASESGVGERRVVAKLCTNANHEASLLGRLEHPNIVPILSVKTDSQKNLSAICMPYMSRTTLAHAIEFLHSRDRRVTPVDLAEMLLEREREAVSTSGQETRFSRKSQLQDVLIEIAIQLCRGLEFAHSRGVIHGDLKPSNILLTRQGTALLMDFNLSQHLRPESQALGGTLAYMAPEQLAIVGQNHRQPQTVRCDERTDVYSFGVLLAELFTGAHPFCRIHHGDAPAESARKLFEQQQTKPVTARDLAPKIGMPLAKILEKCLALAPQQRWASVKELRTALETTLTLKNRTLRWLRRERKRVIGVGAGLCCSLMVASLVYASLPYESEKLVASAAVAMDQGRSGDAIDALIRASDLEEKRLGSPTAETKSLLVKAYFARGNQFLEMAQYPQAIEHLKEAQKLDRSAEPVREALIDAYLQSGTAALNEDRASDAVSVLSKARAVASDLPEILLPLSRALLAEGRFQEAVEAAQQWCSVEQDNARAFGNLGYCFAKQGFYERRQNELFKARFSNAREAFQKALDLPGNVSRGALWNNIGLCELNLRQLKAATDAFSKAKDHDLDFASPSDRSVPCRFYLQLKLRSAIQDNFNWQREFDLRPVEDCVDGVSESAELYVQVAGWYAFAAEKTLTDSVQSQQFLDRCIHYCRLASSLGMTETELEFIQSQYHQLKDHPDWPDWMSKTIAESERESDRNLLEPLL